MENIINSVDKIYALDTNIILDNIKHIETLLNNGDNLIILSDIVIDEIDKKKNGFNEINYQAREFGRYLSKFIYHSSYTIDDITFVLLKNGNLNIIIATKDNYDNDTNDKKILSCYESVNNILSKNIIILSMDILFNIRGRSFSLSCETLNLGNYDIDYEKHKVIKYDKKLNDVMDILDVDKEYKKGIYSYTLIHNHKYYLYVVKNGKIEYINDFYNRQTIKPLNDEQRFFSHAILDDFYNIVIADAKAGTGKTLLAISGAMRLVDLGKYDKIIYIRNSIESLAEGEDVGYLSTNEAKFEIYNFPLYDMLYFIAEKILKKSKENSSKSKKIHSDVIDETVKSLIHKYNIETMWVGGLRGRTIRNAVVIIDECQNFSNSTLLLTGTRIDDNCKVIVIGSNSQIDNKYTNKYTNGLSILLNKAKKEENIHDVNLFACTLKKVHRGKITEFFETIKK